MGFMDNLKKTAVVTKLQGELLLIDREIKTCKENQGVAIYDILAKRQNSVVGSEQDDESQKNPLPLDGLEAAFIATTTDVHEWNHKRNQVMDQIEVLEATKTSRSAGTTAGEKASYMGSVLKDSAQTAKLKTELAYYEREIKLRQGIFGVQVFDELKLMEQNNGDAFPEDDANNVGAILNQARAAMQAVLKKKADKEAEIQAAKEA